MNDNVWVVCCWNPGDGVDPVMGVFREEGPAQKLADELEQEAIENGDVLESFTVECEPIR